MDDLLAFLGVLLVALSLLARSLANERPTPLATLGATAGLSMVFLWAVIQTG